MIKFMIQKLLHKKWMLISLLIGNILLVAIASSNPMYKNASLQRILTDDFAQNLEKNNKYPAILTINSSMVKDTGKETFQTMENLSSTIAGDLGVTELIRVKYQHILDSNAKSLMGRFDKRESQQVRVSNLSDLKDHVTILSGKMYRDEMTKDGFLEAIVSQNTFAKLNLLIGEEYQFETIKDVNGVPIKIRVTGVYQPSSKSDYYWVTNPNNYANEFFISDQAFDTNLINYDKQTQYLKAKWHILIDYTKIKPDQVDHIIDRTTQYTKTYTAANASIIKPDYIDILSEYKINQKKVTATLMILQVPVLVLLCSFIFMISSQMLDMEKNEIAILKSRGSGKGQIITIYLLQSVFIAIISFLLGLPLGSFLCRALGSTNAFLEFVQRRSLEVVMNEEVFLYCFLAAIISICVMVLPVFKHANVTIVNYKQSKNKRNNPLWQKVFLDFVIIGVALYGYYNFTDDKAALIQKVISGKPLDPFLFLSSSLFIVGASLVALRIQPILVKIIFLLRKKRWSPASYASFLQILRTGRKQSFIMVFLMFTIALGIFNATIARTILSNADNNIKYKTGADLIVQEVWKSNSPTLEGDGGIITLQEPDFGKYLNLDGVEALAKVAIYDKDITALTDKMKISATVMAIHTKDFGKTVWFQDDLLPTHINHYLNNLSTNSEAVLLSNNFNTKHGLQIGDTITYRNQALQSIKGVIYGFVDFWPSYESTSTSINSDGTLEVKDNFLIISHYSKVQKEWGTNPYEIWMRVKDSTGFMYDIADEKNMKFTKFDDLTEKLIDVRNNTMFQGTNGILTMSFIVVLILSSAGFLIYWILSIRSRELLFGVFRAMGMSKREINFMLINEQIFSTGISIGSGAFIGILASKLYVPLIQIAYASTDQFIPLQLVTEQNDMIRLFSIIAIMILLCMIILRTLISRIKISQALKLGED